ncbi:MAG: response regulator [Nitrospira sp.]|nr:response regulator [bacterium]MBL7049818.1 response regulator [Nitrospira sp.]
MPDETDSDKIQILMIEDDRIDQMAFERLIREQQLPYNYSFAGSASEAGAILTAQTFDIVISDFSLGDGNAFDVIDFQKHAPVIMITGVGSEEIAVQALKSGAYDYLIKDLERNYLKLLPLTVDNVLKRKSAEDSREQLIHDLQKALKNVKQLSGMLPICSGCKKIRDDQGYWKQLEDYISSHSEAEFTHGLCGDCMERIYGAYLKKDPD